MNQESIDIRIAQKTDLESIVQLLHDDPLGSVREAKWLEARESYQAAFDEIEGDANNEVIVATVADAVVGTLQLTYIPNLSHQGCRRGQIEGVRVANKYRSSRIGSQLIRWALTRCKERGCRLIQLTSDLSRIDAIAFYENLGFANTHAGLKLWL